jgi:hypothetical protein
MPRCSAYRASSPLIDPQKSPSTGIGDRVVAKRRKGRPSGRPTGCPISSERPPPASRLAFPQPPCGLPGDTASRDQVHKNMGRTAKLAPLEPFARCGSETKGRKPIQGSDPPSIIALRIWPLVIGQPLACRHLQLTFLRRIEPDQAAQIGPGARMSRRRLDHQPIAQKQGSPMRNGATASGDDPSCVER